MYFPRLLWLSLALLMTVPYLALAETRYISDELRVPLRQTPCGNCTIVHRGLVAGTRLDLEETRDDWGRVTTSSGLSGWLPLQYLVAKPIARDRLNHVQEQTGQLTQENTKLKGQLVELEDTFAKLETDYMKLQEHSADLEVELSSVKKLSANTLGLQEQNEELIKQTRILQSKVDVLTAAKDQLQRDASQKWFLYGGITVFLGALITLLLPQFKPRKRFSEWG